MKQIALGLCLCVCVMPICGCSTLAELSGNPRLISLAKHNRERMLEVLRAIPPPAPIIVAPVTNCSSQIIGNMIYTTCY